jgi:hypothetical protein
MVFCQRLQATVRATAISIEAGRWWISIAVVVFSHALQPVVESSFN